MKTSLSSGGTASRTPPSATPLQAVHWWTSLSPSEKIAAGANVCTAIKNPSNSILMKAYLIYLQIRITLYLLACFPYWQLSRVKINFAIMLWILLVIPPGNHVKIFPIELSWWVTKKLTASWVKLYSGFEWFFNMMKRKKDLFAIHPNVRFGDCYC